MVNIDGNASTYTLCWDEYVNIHNEYLRLKRQADESGETLAQNADPVELIMLQDDLEGLLEKTSKLPVAARQYLQDATTSLLHTVTSVICDAYLFAADNAADFKLYAIQDDLEVM